MSFIYINGKFRVEDIISPNIFKQLSQQLYINLKFHPELKYRKRSFFGLCILMFTLL